MTPSVRLLPAVVLALAVPASPARADVSARAALHLRATAVRDLPEDAVRFDPAARGFALDGYLVPSRDESFASSFASLAIDGHHLAGDLRWAVAIDSGELRRRRFPEVVPVCFSSGPTGLASPGGGECRLFPGASGPRRVIVPAESTALRAPEATSNGRPLGDEAEATWFVREAYAAASFGRAGFATVRAGRRRLSVADGFVYDDYATGVEVALDLGAIGPRWALSAAVFEPARDLPRRAREVSPMVALRADFLPSLFEHAGLFLAAYRDRSGSAGELLRGALVERLVTEHLLDDGEERRADAQLLALLQAAPTESDARLAWLGTSGNLAPGRGQRLRWTAAVLGGRIDHVHASLRPDPEQPASALAEDLRLSGRLASVGWETDVGRRLTAGASFLYLSGDELPRRSAVPAAAARAPLTGTFGGFLGVAPFVRATNLFFGGGLSESFAARQASAPGVNGRGVLAPGLSLGWDPAAALAVDLSGTWLRADAAGPFGGRVYGTELDLEVTWQLARWLQLGAELDALFPGDFFPGGGTLTKAILAVDVFTP